MIARAIETSISVKPPVDDGAPAVPRLAVARRRGPRRVFDPIRAVDHRSLPRRSLRPALRSARVAVATGVVGARRSCASRVGNRKRRAIGDRFGKPPIRLSIPAETPERDRPRPPQIPAHCEADCAAPTAGGSACRAPGAGLLDRKPPTVEGDSERSIHREPSGDRSSGTGSERSPPTSQPGGPAESRMQAGCMSGNEIRSSGKPV
jgi:hypothetical protein